MLQIIGDEVTSFIFKICSSDRRRVRFGPPADAVIARKARMLIYGLTSPPSQRRHFLWEAFAGLAAIGLPLPADARHALVGVLNLGGRRRRQFEPLAGGAAVDLQTTRKMMPVWVKMMMMMMMMMRPLFQEFRHLLSATVLHGSDYTP